MKLYKISHGSLDAYAICHESAREAARAIESADPYGGIPFVFESVCDDTEALSLIAQNAIENLLKYLESNNEQ